MKPKFLILISVYLVLISVGIFSCAKCGPFADKYRNIGLDWSVYKSIYSDTSSDSKLNYSNINKNDTVDFNTYSISITPIHENYFSQNLENADFNIITTACACSPNSPTTDEKIDSLIILSDKDFNADHKVGSNLSKIFDVIVYDPERRLYYEKFDLQYFLDGKPFVPQNMTLILKEKPAVTDEYQFTVKYYQNGKYNYFEYTTNKVIIK